MMKKIVIISTIALALIQNPPANAASDTSIDTADNKAFVKEESRNELIGFGSGALAGTLVGGPIGGVVGALFGMFVANDVNSDNKIEEQNAELNALNYQVSRQAQEFNALSDQYAQLEQSQMVQLASFDTKLATEWMRDLPPLESNVQFKTASFLVEEPFKAQLKSLAGLLNQYPNLMVKINGFADARGDSQYNRILSEQRADSVKDFLLTQRVKPSQMITQGQGELSPDLNSTTKSDESTQNAVAAKQYESLFFDRRVTLKLLSEQDAMTAAN
jgi:sortase system peptidoglycan-associated protein